METKELKRVLQLHNDYLNGIDGGMRAILSGAFLRGAFLRGADLSGAILSGAFLRGAFLRGADLSGADLSGADLSGAFLRDADLSDADLRGADLSGAILRGAILSGVTTSIYTRFLELSCPQVGAFVAYKKAQGKVIKLQIPEDALRSSATTYKCRASKAIVLEIEGGVDSICSGYDQNFVYRVGDTVEVKDFDPDRWNECSTGIHFFMSENHAKQF